MKRREREQITLVRTNGHAFDVERAWRRGGAAPSRRVTYLVAAVLALSIAAAGIALWQRNQVRGRLDAATRDAARVLARIEAMHGGPDGGAKIGRAHV
jgi:hypothetical protein